MRLGYSKAAAQVSYTELQVEEEKLRTLQDIERSDES